MKSLFCLCIFCFISSIQISGQTNLLEGFQEEVLPYEFTKPVGFVFDHENRTIIWEKDGIAKLIKTDGTLLDSPLIDISEEIASYGDHGLISIILDPYFESNGFIYMYYVVDRHHLLNFGTPNYDPQTTIESQASIGRITRYTLDLNSEDLTVDYDSRKVIFGKTVDDGLPILMTSHGVGTINFGTDGSLIVSCGDSGSFSQPDIGEADDTYQDQALEDGILKPKNKIGAYRAMLAPSVNGKLLRIDPENGNGIPSNPFYDANNPSSEASRVWSLGFRNPYKCIKIPETGSHDMSDGNPGKFLVGDVGASSWEELNLVSEPGQWFGWPIFEGYGLNYAFMDFNPTDPYQSDELETICPDKQFGLRDLVTSERVDKDYTNVLVNCGSPYTVPDEDLNVHIPPVISYSNDLWNMPPKTRYKVFDENGIARGRSITDTSSVVEGQVVAGGSLMPGGFNQFDNFPEEFDNHLFIGDFHGYIFSLELNDDYSAKSINTFLSTPKGITDLKFNPNDGMLYYMHINTGQLRRVMFGGILPPKIVAETSQRFGPSPLNVSFDASESIDYSETGLSYLWDFGDGQSSDQAVVEHQFFSDEVRQFNTTLRINDQLGNERSDDYVVSINNTPPEAQITSISPGQTYATNAYNIIELKAEVSDLEHRQDQLNYEWRVDLYHDNHFHLGVVDTRPESFAILDPLGCGIENYYYKVNLKVTDDAGLFTTDTKDVIPYCDGDIAEIVNLIAEVVEDQIRLTWEVDQVEGLQNMVVERTDYYLFSDLGTLAFDNQSTYSFIDEQPYQGDNFYRIRLINDDGNFMYSDFVKIFFVPDFEVDLKPNPVDQFLNIGVRSQDLRSSEIVNFEIIDISGKILYKERRIANGDFESNFIIDVNNLPAAAYFLSVNIGEKNHTQKFLKL